MSSEAFLGALFGGNDDQVLIGRTTEQAWWNVVRDRHGVGPGLINAIRPDLASRQTWDEGLTTSSCRSCAIPELVV
jgi:putative hydrolase of the HAD superfamily